jgi:hypothetical protein
MAAPFLAKSVSFYQPRGAFLTFSSLPLPSRCQPITVAGPWPIFTAFHSPRAS